MPFNGDFYTQNEGKAPSHDFYTQNMLNKGVLPGSWQMRQAYAQGGARSSGEMRGNINPIHNAPVIGSNPANPGFSSTYARDINTSLGSNGRVGYEASGASGTTGVPNSGQSYNSSRVKGSGSNEEHTIRKFFGGTGKMKKEKVSKDKAASGPGNPQGTTAGSGGAMFQSGNKAGGNNIIGNEISGGNNIVGNDMSGNSGALGNINSGSGTQNNLGAFARQSSLNLSFGPNSPFNNPAGGGGAPPAGAPPVGNQPPGGGGAPPAGAPPAGAPPAAKKARAPRTPKAKPGSPAVEKPASGGTPATATTPQAQPAPNNKDLYTQVAERGIANAQANGGGNGVPGANFIPPNPGLTQTQPQALDIPGRTTGVIGDGSNPSGAPIQQNTPPGAYGGRGPVQGQPKPGALAASNPWQSPMNGYNAYAMQQIENRPKPGRFDMNPLTGGVRPDFGNPNYTGPSRHPQAPIPNFTQGQTGYTGVAMQGIGQADMEMKRQAFRQRSQRPGT